MGKEYEESRAQLKEPWGILTWREKEGEDATRRQKINKNKI